MSKLHITTVKKLFISFVACFSFITISVAEEVGSIPGKFSVSAGGAATYTVSIDVPPGINGLQPGLAIAYSSRGGNGVLGSGWGLSGLSAISRCSKTLAQDDEKHGVDFTHADRLCMGGSRLLLVNGNNADDAAYWSASAEYRTEIESFSKVTRMGPGFKVETKGGRIAEYGNTIDSARNVKVISTNAEPVLSWAVNEISDLSGNSISYVYQEDIENGMQNIQSITYGKNNIMGTTDIYSIVFDYSQRIDKRYTYVAEAKVNNLLKLNKITISMGAEVINYYEFSYLPTANETEELRLDGISKCVSVGQCLPVMSFNWSESGANSFSQSILDLPEYGDLQGINGSLSINDDWGAQYNGADKFPRMMADINGDSLQDIIGFGNNGVWVSIANGNGGFDAPVFTLNDFGYETPAGTVRGLSSSNWRTTDHPRMMSDVNGDGLQDIVGFGEDGVMVALATGTGSYFQAAELWIASYGRYTNHGDDVSQYGGYNYAGGWAADSPRMMSDVNGDGMQDIIAFSYYSVWVSLSTGTQFEAPVLWAEQFGGDQLANIDGEPLTYPMAKWDQSINPRMMTDVNGDGMQDIVGFGNYGVIVSLSTGSGFLAPETWVSAYGHMMWEGLNSESQPWSNTGYFQRTVADVNGDGMQDIVAFGSNGVYVSLSTGTGFKAQEYWLLGEFGKLQFWNSDNFKRMVQDVNGDGLDDIVGFGENGVTVALSTGLNFSAPELWVNSFGAIQNASQSSNTVWDSRHPRLLSDINGDGIADIVGIGEDGVYTSTSNKRSSKIDAISNNGVVTNIYYDYLTNDFIYTKDGVLAEYPVMSYQGPIQVVSNVLADNGVGSHNTLSYKYGGLKIHRRGRGSLGFNWMETTDQQTNIKTRTDFFQAFPYVGRTKNIDIEKGGRTITSTHNLYTYNGSTCVNYPVTSWSLPTCAVGQLPGIVLPYSFETSFMQNDLNNHRIKNVTTNRLYGSFNDNFVDVITTHVTTEGWTGPVFEKVTTNVFGNNFSSDYSQKGQLTQTQSHAIDNGIFSTPITKEFTYNVNGLLQTDTLEPGTSAELIKTYGYDGFGNRTSVEVSGADITTRTSTTEFDVNGHFPELITNALGHTETRTYDPKFGVLASQTGPNGLTTTFEYDSFGRNTASVSSNGNRSEITREWCDVNLGHICMVPAINTSYPIPTLSQTVSYIITSRTKGSNLFEFVPPVKTYFDKFNREIRRESTGFDGSKIYIDTNYDSLGRVVAKTQPYFSTDILDQNADGFVYDVLGRITDQYSASGTHNEILYDALIVTTNKHIQNPNRTETKVDTYNAIGQLVSTLDNNFLDVEFGYDANGNRTTTTDPQGNVITIQYDKLGRKEWIDDPDMGRWDYTYNVLGELTTQKDAKAQVTSIQYDVLGRMTKRADHDGLVSEWFYNDNLKAGNTPRNKAIGKLDYETSSNGYRRDLYYDNYGRPSYSNVNISVTNYRTDTTYDAYSRLDTIKYPDSIGRFEVKHAYQNGFMHKVTSPDGALTYWQADFMRADGQVQSDHYGNNIQIMRDFDSSGRTTWLNMGDANTIYEAYYSYDSISNVTQRTTQRDQGAATVLIEDYGYDGLNRLTSVNINGMGNVNTDYDGLGNITNKTGVGAYTYHANKPHAVETVGLKSYVYDANGSVISGDGRTVTWSSYNKPTHIENTEARSDFDYGPGRSRFRHTDLDKTAGSTQVTHYVGDSFEKVIKGTLTEYKHYIRAAGQTIAVHTKRSNSVTSTEYLLRDTQGTVVAATNETGEVKGHFDYDAFGSRRPILGQSFISDFIDTLPRGYTGHEHLDKLGLIHMNGRVYDPQIARFLSADPIVQAPNNLQSLNRYSYVMNNPIGFTDPSGFYSWDEFKEDAQGLRDDITDGATNLWTEIDDAWANTWDEVDDFLTRLDEWGYEHLPEGGEVGYNYEGRFDGGGGNGQPIIDISGNDHFPSVPDVEVGVPYADLDQTGGSFLGRVGISGGQQFFDNYLYNDSISAVEYVLAQERIDALTISVYVDYPSLPRDIDVVAVPDHYTFPGNRVYGMTVAIDRVTISYNRDMSDAFQQATIAHEFLHVDEMKNRSIPSTFLYEVNEFFEHGGHDPWIKNFDRQYENHLNTFGRLPKPRVEDAKWRSNKF